VFGPLGHRNPPADRLAVRTVVSRFDDDVVREALNRELSRGARRTSSTTASSRSGHGRPRPEPRARSRVGVGHGQMRERDLEAVMEAFVAGELDILVCTAIVESGLDIPRANTIVINRADLFGLADLYQLRGGSGAPTCAPTPTAGADEPELPADARKRLQVLQEFTELGAGFKIAPTTWRSEAPGSSSGRPSPGTCRPSGSTCTPSSSTRRSEGSRGARGQGPGARDPAQAPGALSTAYVETRASGSRCTTSSPRRRRGRGGRGPVRADRPVRAAAPEVDNLLEVMKLRRCWWG